MVKPIWINLTLLFNPTGGLGTGSRYTRENHAGYSTAGLLV